MKKTSLTMIFAALLSIVMLVSACSGPEEKKIKFLTKGKALYEEKNYTMARLELKNAIQIDVNFVEAYYYLGLVELGDKQYSKAFSYLSKAETLDSDNLDVKIELGKLLLAAREREKSKKYVDSILAADPDHSKGRLLKSSILLIDGKINEAKVILDDLRNDGETDPQLYMLYSGYYQKMSMEDKAEDILIEGKLNNPEDMALKVSLALFYRKNKDSEKLAGIMKEMITLEPFKDEHKFALANVYWGMERKKDAKILLEETLKESDEKEITEKNYISLANFYLRLKENQLTEQTLKNGLTRFQKNTDLTLALSLFYYQDKRADEGYSILENTMKSIKDKEDPGLIKIKTRLAEIHIQKNEIDKASPLISDVLSVSSKNVDALYMKAVIDMSEDKYDEAITSLRTVSTEKPQFVNGHLNLVRAYILNNQPELAYDSLKRSVNEIPTSKQLRMALIRFHMKNEEIISAEKEFEAMNELYPDDKEVLGAFGDFYLTVKKIDKAKGKYSTIKTRFPNDNLGYLKMATLYISQGQKEKAVKELQTAHDINPDNPNVISVLVKVLAEQKQFAKAVSLCQGQIDKNNNEALFYNLLGRLHATEKKYDLSEKALRKAAELRPDWREPHVNLAKLYVAQKKQKEAIQTFESMVKDDPDNISASLLLAILYENDERYDQAISQYKHIVNKVPDNLDALNNLAFLMGEYKKSPEEIAQAIDFAQQVVNKRPNNHAARDTLAWLHYRAGNLDKANALLNQVMLEEPDNPEIFYHAGMVYFKQEKFQEAKQALEKCLAEGNKKFRGYEDAKSTLDQVNARLNG